MVAQFKEIALSSDVQHEASDHGRVRPFPLSFAQGKQAHPHQAICEASDRSGEVSEFEGPGLCCEP
jgi:hypothetical protein